MSEGSFQLIAATPGRSPQEVAELAERVGDLFDVELSGLLSALARTGVCVATADTLAEARAKGARIISAGADYRVLDGSGKQVDAGEAKGRVAITPRTPGRGSRTMMGMGAHLIGMAAQKPQLEDSGGFADAGSSIAEGGVDLDGHAEEIELEDSGGFATIDSSVADGAMELSDSAGGAIALDDTGGFAAANSSIADGAVELSAPAGKIELDNRAGGFASAPTIKARADSIDVPAGPDVVELEGPGGFITAGAKIADGAVGLDSEDARVSLPIPPPVLVSPPRQGGGLSLDALDGDALVMLDGTDEAKERSADDMPAIAVDDSSFMPPEEDELGEGALDIEVPRPAPSRTDQSVADDAVAPIVGEVVEVPAQPPAAAPAAPVVEPLAAPSTSVHSAKVATTATTMKRQRKDGSVVLLGGWFSERPRVRVVVGFVAALLLTSVLPLCHARSIRTARIEELRVDLATAKAHGAAVAGNRTPTEIEANISSLQTRHTVYALAMWCALMGLLLFFWFRFT